METMSLGEQRRLHLVVVCRGQRRAGGRAEGRAQSQGRRLKPGELADRPLASQAIHHAELGGAVLSPGGCGAVTERSALQRNTHLKFSFPKSSGFELMDQTKRLTDFYYCTYHSP